MSGLELAPGDLTADPAILDGAAKLAEGFEGFSSVAYRCPAGVWTIGYGSTRDGNGHAITAATPPISRAMAHELMVRDLGSALHSIHAFVTVPLYAEEFEALVDFVYNCGAGAFSHSTLLRKLNDGDYEGAAAGLDDWNKGGGKVLAGLVRRRAAERALFEGS